MSWACANTSCIALPSSNDFFHHAFISLTRIQIRTHNTIQTGKFFLSSFFLLTKAIYPACKVHCTAFVYNFFLCVCVWCYCCSCATLFIFDLDWIELKVFLPCCGDCCLCRYATTVVAAAAYFWACEFRLPHQFNFHSFIPFIHWIFNSDSCASEIEYNVHDSLSMYSLSLVEILFSRIVLFDIRLLFSIIIIPFDKKYDFFWVSVYRFVCLFNTYFVGYVMVLCVNFKFELETNKFTLLT